MKTPCEWVDEAMELWEAGGTLTDSFQGAIAAAIDAEREACAVVVDEAEVVEAHGNTYYAQLGDARESLKAAAAAIRARKETA